MKRQDYRVLSHLLAQYLSVWCYILWSYFMHNSQSRV